MGYLHLEQRISLVPSGGRTGLSGGAVADAGKVVVSFEEACGRVNSEVFVLTRKYQGSVSAEHGIGLLKRDYLSYCRSGADIERMRGIKAVFDPMGIMNPGKLLG